MAKEDSSNVPANFVRRLPSHVIQKSTQPQKPRTFLTDGVSRPMTSGGLSGESIVNDLLRMTTPFF